MRRRKCLSSCNAAVCNGNMFRIHKFPSFLLLHIRNHAVQKKSLGEIGCTSYTTMAKNSRRGTIANDMAGESLFPGLRSYDPIVSVSDGLVACFSSVYMYTALLYVPLPG